MKKKEDFITKITLFGLGIVETTAEGLKELTDEVMKKGRMKKPEAKAFVDDLISEIVGVKDSIEKKVKTSVNKFAKDIERATRVPPKSKKKV